MVVAEAKILFGEKEIFLNQIITKTSIGWLLGLLPSIGP
jgi:hypothetical protein